MARFALGAPRSVSPNSASNPTDVVRIAFLPFAIVLLFLTVKSARAQTSATNVVRDGAAISLLQSSVSAMGGTNNWASVVDWTITGSVSMSASAQASKTFSWKGAGREFRLEVDDSTSTSVFLSGHGTPARISNGTSTAINYHVARASLPFYLPAYVLQRELNNSQLTLRYVGAATTNGRSALQVHVSDDSDAVGSLVTPHDWYFDPTSFLPLRVEFRLPANENAADYVKGAFDFAQFQPIAGLLVPFQVVLSRDYPPAKAFAVASVVFNSGLPVSVFDPSNGGNQ